MAKVQGVTGIGAVSGVVPVPEGNAALIQGAGADPRHGDATVQTVYPWQHVPAPGYTTQRPYGTEPGLWDDQTAWGAQPAALPSDDPRGDLTPDTHAAPWPSTGLRDGDPRSTDTAVWQARQSAEIHASNTGAGREVLYEDPLPKTPVEVYQWDTAGSTLLVPVPAQIMDAGMGAGYPGPNTDRVQSHARQNEYGFDQAHNFDRRMTPGVPGNRLWLRPGGRPMVIEPHGSTNTFDGPDSPFSGAGWQHRSRTVRGAALRNQTQVYTPPPEAADLVVAAPPPADPVWSSGAFGG